MPAVAVSEVEGLMLRVGKQRVPLTPAQGFALAESLIRGATRAIVHDEADRAAVRDVVGRASGPR